MSKVKKVFKYGTGHNIPDKAVYLHTRIETIPIGNGPDSGSTKDFVWHYFLVEVEE